MDFCSANVWVFAYMPSLKKHLKIKFQKESSVIQIIHNSNNIIKKKTS